MFQTPTPRVALCLAACWTDVTCGLVGEALPKEPVVCSHTASTAICPTAHINSLLHTVEACRAMRRQLKPLDHHPQGQHKPTHTPSPTCCALSASVFLVSSAVRWACSLTWEAVSLARWLACRQHSTTQQQVRAVLGRCDSQTRNVCTGTAT